MSEAQEPKQRRAEFDDALRGYYTDHDEFRPEDNPDYRSLTAESVGSLILGFLSVLTFISGIFVIFPIMGIILGLLAIRKILGASEVLSGLGISSAGVALSAVIGGTGIAYQIYASSFDIPTGYTPIDFMQLSADPATGRISEEILDLAYKRDENNRIVPLHPKFDAAGNMIVPPPVFLEGYMFPTKNMTDIDFFMLVPSLEQGKFGSLTRSPTEMVEVNLLGGLKVPYRTSPVRVGGLLFVNENYTGDAPPYHIEADALR
jgi:hypothetical protein